MQKVHWTKLQSNPYLQALHPDMLTDTGFKLEKLDRIVGMSRYAEKIPLEVTFDKTFLIQHFERSIFEKLQIREWNQIQGILSEAWKAYRDKQKT